MLDTALYSAYEEGWYAGLELEPEMLLSEWSDEYRVLNQKSSAEPGKWKTERTPYLKEIMDGLSPICDEVNEISFMKGAQIGGTEAGNNWTGFVIHKAPGPMMVVQPTVDLGKRWSRQRIGPMIDDMPVLQERIRDSRSRDSGNTVLSKDFDGGVIIISGANSAAGLRSMPVRYLDEDEIDAYPLDVDGEGDPCELAENRTKTYGRRKKIFRVSTPTVDGLSRIQKNFKKGDQRYYFVPCPHCHEHQVLKWQNIKYENNDPSTTYYMCEHNGCVIDESNKTWMLANGEWRATAVSSNPRHRSYHLSSLYSPLGWESWSDIVEKFIEAKTDIEKMKTWKNTRLAETWKEQINDVQADQLSDRAEDYPLRWVPSKAPLVVAGIDTQPDRFEVCLYAFGPGEESWCVDYHVIYGDPDEDSTKAELDEYLLLPLDYEDGGQLRVASAFHDSGGHNTHSVYDFCRSRKKRKIFAIKGASKSNAPIVGRASLVDVNFLGKTIKHGCQLWNIGVSAAKHVIYSRLVRKEVGAGYIHLSKHLPEEFFSQITAEKLQRRYKKGFPVYEWVKQASQPNEVLDCTVYAYACALRYGIQKMSDHAWNKLKHDALAACQPSLFDQQSSSKVISSSKTGGGFKEVNPSW